MKKIIAVIAAVCMLQGAASAKAAELTQLQLNDLRELNLMVGDPDGDFRAEDTLTRAEAVRIIAAASGFEPQTAAGTAFPDVAAGHWAAGYIEWARGQGIIAGDENGFFNPDKPVTHEELLKMLVCLLGYDDMVQASSDSYPENYRMTASMLGLTAGMTLPVNEPALRGTAGAIICNAIDTPYLILTEASDNGNTYSQADGKKGRPLKTIRSEKGMVE